MGGPREHDVILTCSRINLSGEQPFERLVTTESRNQRNKQEERDMKRLAMNIILGGMLLGTVTAALADDPPKGTIKQRQRNQQKRIAEGVNNGSLTPAETARLEKQEAAIHQEVKSERKANGGTLTPQERRQVTRQQNRVSKRIYRQKHDGQHQ